MKYAAYGSNLHPLRLRERAPSARLINCLELPNWRLRLHKRGRDGSAKCNIVPADDSVFFAVYELAAADKSRLDRIEGLSDGYEETVIDIPGHGPCLTYVASASHVDDRLRPFSWYKELVLAGIEYHRFPHAYAQRIHDAEHRIDEDRDRHDLNMAIVERIRGGG